MTFICGRPSGKSLRENRETLGRARNARPTLRTAQGMPWTLTRRTRPRVSTPRARCHDAAEGETPFTPLHLLLQPGGLVVELNRPEMMLGRHSQSDIRVALPDVSRRHCRFVFEAGQWHLFDLNSLNGTFVNGGTSRKSRRARTIKSASAI